MYWNIIKTSFDYRNTSNVYEINVIPANSVVEKIKYATLYMNEMRTQSTKSADSVVEK